MARSCTMRRSSVSGVLRGIARAVLVGSLVLGCSRAEPSQAQQGTEHGVIVLPNSVVVSARANEISGVGPDGKVKWTLKLEPDQTILGGLAAAPNSAVYVRTTSALRALSPDGEWLWKVPLPSHGVKGDSSAYSPAAMTDSAPVLLVEGQTYRAYTLAGEPRWDITLDASEVPRSPPQVAADGQVYVNTDQSLYAILPSGKLHWRLGR